jgi:hypothetical protein
MGLSLINGIFIDVFAAVAHCVKAIYKGGTI